MKQRYSHLIGNKHNFKHGLSRTPEYQSWIHMKDRCLNPKSDHWSMYGGRGIKICDRWMSFELFLFDMGVRPSLKYTLDRIDNEGNYTPSNCRWTTWDNQFRNRRYNYEKKQKIKA